MTNSKCEKFLFLTDPEISIIHQLISSAYETKKAFDGLSRKPTKSLPISDHELELINTISLLLAEFTKRWDTDDPNYN